MSVLDSLVTVLTSALSRIVLAILVFVIGRFVIRKLLQLLARLKSTEKLDPTVRSFLQNFCKVALYIILVISIISILGVPMASVITVLASAGVAVGMALQGSLSNLAGGIMLLIFRPFSVGDYIAASSEEGTVRAITLFYTELVTVDNKKILIPNGTLMNASVTNYSSEPTRRVDIAFTCARDEDPAKVRGILLDAASRCHLVLADPAPAAVPTGAGSDSLEFTIRAWTKNQDYWEVYSYLMTDITESMTAAGIKGPAARVITEEQ